MSDDKELYDFSRRKLLAGLGTIGAASAGAGLGTSALLWDEEQFGNMSNPNVFQAGTIDLKVDWETNYYDWIDNDGDGTVDEDAEGGVEAEYPLNQTSDSTDVSGGVLVELADVKPGDVFETTYSLELNGNPAYLDSDLIIVTESEGPAPNEPETKADSSPNEMPEIADHIYVVFWHDNGDNLPDEIWASDNAFTPDWSAIRGGDEAARKEYVMELTEADTPQELFAGHSGHDELSDDTGGLFDNGTLREVSTLNERWPEAVLAPESGVLANEAQEFDDDTTADTNLNKCYAPVPDGGYANQGEGTDFPNADPNVTEYIGFLAWVPRDIPGVNDNVIQGDSVGFTQTFEAIQCRHNPLPSDGANAPMNGSTESADNEST